MQRGKHVYLEKPMAHSVWEVRKLTDLAREKKLATQLGVQRHTLKSIRKSVELIKSGAIGDVTAVHSWIASSRGMPEVPTKVVPVPANLKWDLWLGPTPERPYTDGYAPYDWRFFWDFGTGEAGNWGCHILDIPFWALDLKYPTKVKIAKAEAHPQTTPKSMESRLDFPANDKRPAVALHWYQGVPEILAQHKLDAKNMNNLFIGSKGMLLTGFNTYKLLPEENFKDYKEPESFLYKSPGFHEEWMQACRGGTPASCNFDYSGPMTETVLLANAAYRAGGGFAWDAKALKQTGNDNAEKYLTSEFRKGWEI
jgi:predicted dehydrogenase